MNRHFTKDDIQIAHTHTLSHSPSPKHSSPQWAVRPQKQDSAAHPGPGAGSGTLASATCARTRSHTHLPRHARTARAAAPLADRAAPTGLVESPTQGAGESRIQAPRPKAFVPRGPLPAAPQHLSLPLGTLRPPPRVHTQQDAQGGPEGPEGSRLGHWLPTPPGAAANFSHRSPRVPAVPCRELPQAGADPASWAWGGGRRPDPLERWDCGGPRRGRHSPAGKCRGR